MTVWWSGLTPLNQLFWGLVVLFSTLFVWQLVSAFGGLVAAGDGDLDGGAGLDHGGDGHLFGGHDGDGHFADGHFADAHVGDAHLGDAHLGDVHVADAHLGDAHLGDAHAADLHAGDAQGVDDHAAHHHSSGVATFRLLSVRSILAFLTLFSWAAALYLGADLPYARAFLLAASWGMAGMVTVAAFFWAMPRLSEEGTMDVSSTVGMTATVYVHIPRQGTGQVRVLVGERVAYLRARSASGLGLKAGSSVRVVGVDGSILEVEEVR